MSKRVQIGGFALLVLVAVVAATFVMSDSAVAPKPADTMTQNSIQNQGDSDDKSATPIRDVTSLVIGDAQAPITIIEYGDFLCPICKRFFDTTGPELKRQYIDTGKAKLDFRVETHIGEGSVNLGEAAYCAAEQGKFVEFHDYAYANQGYFDTGIDNLIGTIPSRIGLDAQTFGQCMSDHKYLDAVRSSHKEAESRITGTPTFFIVSENGEETKVVGAQPIGIFQQILNGGK